GTYEQWGYNDTIKDLFVDMIAGLVMAVSGLLLMKQGTFRTTTDGPFWVPTGQPCPARRGRKSHPPRNTRANWCWG
ncbi:MAG: hypothetical protein R6U98_12430, partial [Pirellulaceae bacterium]